MIVENSKREFEALVAPHFEALYRAAFRLTRRVPDAEDLVQEVCLRAYSEIATLGQLDYVLGWLLRVQYRVFVDGDRRRRRSPLTAIGAGSEDQWASESPGPEDLMETALEKRRLESAWQRLSHGQRALLALHAEGYGLSELEAITGKSRNVLSARLHRARRRLSKLLHADPAACRSMKPTVTRHEL